jgi:hypothetical protein
VQSFDFYLWKMPRKDVGGIEHTVSFTDKTALYYHTVDDKRDEAGDKVCLYPIVAAQVDWAC